MSANRRSSLDTWSDLSSDATYGTTEFSYTTDPGWAAEAVVQTPTGIELNFERLNSLCVSESLPSRISIDVMTFSASSISRSSRPELPSDDTIESTHFSPSNRNVAKLNGAKISPWTNQQAKNQQTKASHPKFTRKESIIEQEIRLQKEREKELSLEREMIAKAKLTSPTDEQKGEKPLKNTKAAPQPVEDGLPSPVINSKSSTPKNKTKSLFQLQGSVSSPKEDAADSKLPSPWYSSESPIARDIRTTHEREEELKTARRQSCQPLPTGKP